MNILVISNDIPAVNATGMRMRLSHVIHALSALGNVDLFAMIEPDESGPALVPPDCPVRWVQTVIKSPTVPLRGRQLLSWIVHGRVPAEFFGRPYGPLRRVFASRLDGPYDLVWFGRAETHLAFGRYVQAPTVLDMDDLEDFKIRGMLAAAAADAPRPLSFERVRYHGLRLRWLQDVRQWRRLQLRAARATSTTVLCSAIDRQRLSALDAAVDIAVVPNGYELIGRPVGRVPVGDPPTIVFPGFLRYPPNVDGARVLVERIAPLIRARLPEVRIRLVGQECAAIRALARAPEVVVTGWVPDIAAELARADLLAVPVRYGSGTRIKILEAFAHCIPVVSTSIGAEGIDATCGKHLLVADTIESFAAVCADVLTNRRLRTEITQAAHHLFLRRYQWSTIRDRITAMGAAVAGRDQNGGEKGRHCSTPVTLRAAPPPVLSPMRGGLPVSWKGLLYDDHLRETRHSETR